MRPRLSSSAVGLLAASGCGGGWVLTLDPDRFPNQRPVSPDALVTLTVRDDGPARFVPLGTGAERRWVLEDVDALEGARLGLLVQDADAGPAAYAPGALLAWGESAPVVGHDGDLVATLVVGVFGAPGTLRPVEDGGGAAFAAAGTTAAGTTWLFGGAQAGAASAAVRRLDDPDGGARGFVRAADLPDADADGAPDPTVGAAAVARPDGQLLVTGGAPTLGARTPAAALFDPTTAGWSWSGTTTRARAGHRAFASPDGASLLVGGDGEDAPTWEAYVDGRFEDRGALPVGADGFAGAPVDDGVLVCGGAGRRDRTPGVACVVLDAGASRAAAPLPIALHGHVMVALSDGRVLAAGGFTGACASDAPCWASSRAFVYGPGDVWTEVGPTNRPRGGAAGVPTQDGRAVVFGGAEAAGGGPVFDPIDCAEVFDGSTFTSTGPCHPALAGVSPIVGFHPDQGAVVVAGYTDEDDGGVDVVFVSTGPPDAVVNGEP